MGDHTKLKPPSLWRQEPDEPTLLLPGQLARVLQAYAEAHPGKPLKL